MDHEETMMCQSCERTFPARLLAPLIVNRKQFDNVCPLCALRERNRVHGLPEDEPFFGEIAHAMWLEAKGIVEAQQRRLFTGGELT